MKRSVDLILAVGIIGVVLLMIVPLPSFLLDILLSFSLVFAVMTLLVTLYIKEVKEFSSFPSLLLFLTFFRLAINIATGRMILARAEAGKIIATFGEFVVSDSLFVGALIFILLTVINFIVITKGAGRIAEVAARFTLEALPGKQMAIDSALSSRVITFEEGQKERRKITSEAEFYGAMDGASKFVRGEAIASLIITFCNMVGGLIVGLIVHKESLADSVMVYTKLTIGDGLVTQIPALLVSLGAGIMVSRVSNERVGHILPVQVLKNPQAMIVAALFLIALSFIPGMPFFVMLPIGMALLFGARLLVKSEKKKEIYHTIELILGAQERSEEKVAVMKREIEKRLGFTLPSVALSHKLQGERYTLVIKGVTVASGSDFNEAKIREAIEKEAHRLINRQDVSSMVEEARKVDAAVLEELFLKKVNLGHILKVLQNLLKERVSIGDFVSILEAMADGLTTPEINPDLLTEHVRKALSRNLVEPLLDKNGSLHAIVLESQVEEMIAASIQKGLRPKTLANIDNEVSALLEKATKQGIKPVIITSVKSRKALASLLEKHLFSLSVLSYNEITEHAAISTYATIKNDILI